MNDSMVAPVGDPEPAAETRPKVTMTGGSVPSQTTSYVLLLLEANGNYSVAATGQVARSSDAAVRTFAENIKVTNENGITLVAIPERSWKPVKVTAKVTTSLVIEEAS